MAETEMKDIQFYKKLFGRCKEGSLITMTLPDKKILKFDASEFEKAAEDLQKRGEKVNGYICVCTRRSNLPPGSRGSLKDLVLMPGLYGDYDVLGPAHKQENLPKSKEEVIAHLKGLIMPPSLIVDSGYGLQPYWIFKTPLSLSGDNERAFGKAISEGWGQHLLCEAAKLGWKIDNVSDPARMLRAPGTKNHKQGEGVPCQVIWDSNNLYEADDFEEFIGKGKYQHQNGEKKDDGFGDVAYAERPDQNTIGDADRLLQHCGCIKTMVEEPDSITEPLWYAFCTNVALAKDGPAKFHEWSAYYSDYKHEETEYKIKRALEMKRPCTCEYIQKTLCFECPVYCQGLKAPIVHAQLTKEEQMDEALSKELNLDEIFSHNVLILSVWAKEESPAQYAKMKQVAKKAGVGLRDFEKAVSKEKRESQKAPFDVYRDELFLDDLETSGMKVPKDWMVSMDGIQKLVRANRFIFENSYDAILLTTPDGGVHRANDAACQMFQMTEEEICQRGREGLVDPKEDRVEAALNKRSLTGKVKAELNLVRKDGSVFPTDLTSALFTDSQEKQWTAMIIRDISLFKNAETVMRKAQDDANWYATTDFLTGILNRRILMDRIDIEMTRAKRVNSTLSILMLDIDSFKSVNDNLGHNAGDLVLQRFADLLFKKLRPYDFVGRYGGDEFLVCLPNTAYPTSVAIAERIRGYAEELYITYSNQQIPITTSIGVSTFYGDNTISINDFIAAADKNMYIAKESKNCVYGIPAS